MFIWNKLTVKWKLTILFLLVILAIMGAGFWSFTNSLSRGFGLEQKRLADNIVRLMNNVIATFEQDLHQTITLLQQNESLTTAAYFANATGETEELHNIMASFLGTLAFDTLGISDSTGKMLAWEHLPEKPETLDVNEDFMQQVLDGEQHFSIIAQEERVVLRLMAPLMYTDELVGTLVSGICIDDTFAQNITGITDGELVIFQDATPIASSSQVFQEALQRSISSIQHVETATIRQLDIEDTEYAIITTPFTDHQDTAIGTIVIGLSNTELNAIQIQTEAAIVKQVGLLVCIAIILVYAASAVTVRPLVQMAHKARAIAEGNFGQRIQIRRQDEIGQLADAFRSMEEKIQAVMQEMKRVMQTIQYGQLDNRGDAAAFTGGWKELVTGMNQLLDVLVTPLNMTARYIERLSQTDIPEPITEEYQGDFDRIKQNLNTLVSDIRTVLAEIDRLSRAVQEGNLDARGDIEAFGGGWRELVTGFNSVIDALVKPIHLTSDSIELVSVGNIPDLITEEYQGDFNTIKHNLNQLIRNVRDITEAAEIMANGDLTIELHQRSEHDTLMQALQAMITTLNRTVLNVKTAAESVAARSREMSSIAEQMSQGATQQAAAAEEASSSMEEMAANIRQNADNAKTTEKIALQSAVDAREGKVAVTNIIEAMEIIAEKIASVQEIADQTNILSLNATIEAAKAQDYGKGFAVVATSVRDLAQRSRGAADEINLLVRSCVSLSEQAGEVLERLVPNSEKTAELVQEISAASQEQSTGADQVNGAIQQLDSVTQHNAATAEQLSATAETLANRAEDLQEATAFFTVKEEEEELPASQNQNVLEVVHTLLNASDTDRQQLAEFIQTVLKGKVPHLKEEEHTEESESERKKSEEPQPEKDASGLEIHLEQEQGQPDEYDRDFEKY